MKMEDGVRILGGGIFILATLFGASLGITFQERIGVSALSVLLGFVSSILICLPYFKEK